MSYILSCTVSPKAQYLIIPYNICWLSEVVVWMVRNMYALAASKYETHLYDIYIIDDIIFMYVIRTFVYVPVAQDMVQVNDVYKLRIWTIFYIISFV